MLTPTKPAGRVARSVVAATGAIASPLAFAHGEHGPGGHDGWSLDHFELTHWSATDWGIGMLLVVAALAGWRALRRKPARRRSLRE